MMACMKYKSPFLTPCLSPSHSTETQSLLLLEHRVRGVWDKKGLREREGVLVFGLR